MDIHALMKLSYGLYVAGAKDGEKMVGCIVDAVAQATMEPPAIVLSCGRTNRTNEVIHETGTFTLSVLPQEIEPFFIANFGFQSSRNTDKWADVPYDLSEGLPILRGCVAYTRCRVEQMVELSTHTLFIAHVEDAWLGMGEPLTYAEYQKLLKDDAMKAFRAFQATGEKPELVTRNRMARPKEEASAALPESKGVWRCNVCGYVYDGKVPFEELPDSYVCPVCKQPKQVFVKE